MDALQEQNQNYSMFILEELHRQIYPNPEDKLRADPRRKVFIETNDFTAWLYASPLPNKSASEKRILAVICLSEIKYLTPCLTNACSVTIYLDTERSVSERNLDKISEKFLEEKGEVLLPYLNGLDYPGLIKKVKGGF